MTILITGASGQLGCYVLRELQGNSDVVAWSGRRAGIRFGVPLQPVDLLRPDDVKRAFRGANPSVILHTAAMTRVAECYREPNLTWKVNVEGTKVLATLAAEMKAKLIYTSTDLVFDGQKGAYAETDPAHPLSVYGRSKLEAEKAVLDCPGAVVARMSLLFGPALDPEHGGFFDYLCNSLRQGKTVNCFHDEWRTPLSLATAARMLLALARSDFAGVIHLGGPECMSRLEMGQRLARFLKVDEGLVRSVSRQSALAEEPRPRDTSLNCSKWRQEFPAHPWLSWDEAVQELFTAGA